MKFYGILYPPLNNNLLVFVYVFESHQTQFKIFITILILIITKKRQKVEKKIIKNNFLL